MSFAHLSSLAWIVRVSTFLVGMAEAPMLMLRIFSLNSSGGVV